MIKKIIPLTLALLLAPSLQAECVRTHEKPPLPNGKNASTEQMLEAKAAIDEYIAYAEEYLTCLRKEEKATIEAGAETEETTKIRLKAYNGAVDDMETMAEEFNTQIKLYKAQKPPK